MFSRLNWRVIFLLFCCLCFRVTSADSKRVIPVRTPDDGIQPQAAVDDRGVIHLIYYKGDPAAGDIFYVRREAREQEFSKPIRVNSQSGSAMALGSIRGPQLALGKNGRVHVAWDGMGKGANRVTFNGKEVTPLLYTRLNDGGTAFEPERNIISFAYGLDGGSSVAADQQGNVFVMWHAAKPGNTNGEAGRAVFLARSLDEGKTFSSEKLATAEPTGACGCCGMKAFADSRGNLFALYRSASTLTNRDETLLMSRNRDTDFQIVYAHQWNIGMCPMSSAFLSEGSRNVLAAAETHGRVFFVRVDPATGKVSKPISPETKGKNPVAIANRQGEILLAWTEGTAWAKGGAVAWQLYDQKGNPTAESGQIEGVPVWSLVAAVPDSNGNFVLIY